MVNLRQRAAAISLVLIIGFMLAACDSSSPANTPIPNPSGANTPVPNTTVSSNPYVEMVKQAGTNMKSAKSYHVEGVGDMGGSPVQFIADIDRNANNVRMTTTAEGQTLDTVQIGNDMYASTDGGKTFSRTDPGTLGLDSYLRFWEGFQPSGLDKTAATFKEGNPATEVIDGVTTKHIIQQANVPDSAVSTDYWLTTDPQPFVKQMKLAAGSGAAGVNITMKWSKFNENFDIKAPQLGTPKK